MATLSQAAYLPKVPFVHVLEGDHMGSQAEVEVTIRLLWMGRKITLGPTIKIAKARAARARRMPARRSCSESGTRCPAHSVATKAGNYTEGT